MLGAEANAGNRESVMITLRAPCVKLNARFDSAELKAEESNRVEENL